MITERSNPRANVMRWLSGLRRMAASEKAQFAVDEIDKLAEPMFAMVAGSEAADPEKMQVLLESAAYPYPDRARKYLEKNWFLIVGLPSFNEAENKQRDLDISTAAREAVTRLTDHVSAAQPTSLAGIIAATEATARVLSSIPGEVSKMHSDGTATLLREAIGLPGDVYVAGLITDPAIVRNAAVALTQLGAKFDLTPFQSLDQVVHQGRISDWRVDGAHDEADAPLSDPVSVTVRRTGDVSVDVFINGAENDGTGPGQSSLRIEREADVTRFMIYDANCDAPRVFGVRDGEPLAELPNDWEESPRQEAWNSPA